MPEKNDFYLKAETPNTTSVDTTEGADYTIENRPDCIYLHVEYKDGQCIAIPVEEIKAVYVEDEMPPRLLFGTW